MATKAALYEDLNRVLEDLTGLEAQYLDLAEAVPVVAWAPVPPEFDLYRNPFSIVAPLLDVPGTMQLYRDGSIRAAAGDLPPSTDSRLGALYTGSALVDRLSADRTELRYHVLVTTWDKTP
jgi:hypothetical protein